MGELVADTAKLRILTAAKAGLRKTGASELTIDMVAEDAGCAKGLIHYHYKTKDQLVAAAADSLLSDYDAKWSAALRSGSPDEAISKTWALVVAEARDGTPHAWASIKSYRHNMTDQTVKAVVDRLSVTLASGIRDLLDRSGFSLTISTDEVGRLAAAAVQGFEFQLAAGVAPESLEGAYAALWVGILALTRPTASATRRR